jgi:F0F1-type ATP synthase delta subunit
MKIKPQIYAQMLVEILNEKSDVKNIAEKLWRLLQKNKQYRDLAKIIDMVDQEYAKRHNLVLAKVYSENKLDETQTKEITDRLALKFGKKFILKPIIDKNCGGIAVKVDDKIIDLSVTGKINDLKKRLVNI